MAAATPKLKCDVIARLSKDLNWWVEKLSGKSHWDLDEDLGIIDPRQMSHLFDLLDSLREYGFHPDTIETAFFKFRIVKELPPRDSKGRILLTDYDSDRETDEHLFRIPDILDEEKGPYADFIEHITEVQVKMLNDVSNFKRPLTVDKFKEKIREIQHTDPIEGGPKHFFNELITILEDVPRSYELHLDEDEENIVESQGTTEEKLISDFEESGGNEVIEGYEPVQWEEVSEERD